MEELNNDRFAKEILQNSMMNLTNMDFEKLVMQKVKAESRRRNIIHNGVLYLSIFVAIDAFIFAILKLTNFNMSYFSSGLTIHLDKAVSMVKLTGLSGLLNHSLAIYFFAFVLLMLIMKMIDSGLGHSGVHGSD